MLHFPAQGSCAALDAGLWLHSVAEGHRVTVSAAALNHFNPFTAFSSPLVESKDDTQGRGCT